MLTGSEPRRILHGRHENQTIHDENGMRHYYEEWGRWMNRMPSQARAAVLGIDVGCRRVVKASDRRIAPPTGRIRSGKPARTRPD